jgi:hypothetical protein
VDSFCVDVINDLVSMWKQFDSCLRVRLKLKNRKETQQIIRINAFGVPAGYCDIVDEEEITPRDTRSPSEVEKTLKRSAAETTVASSKRQNVSNEVNGNVPAQKERLLDKVYGIVRKITGTLGGSGSQGAPIYGELTKGSMTRMVELMKASTGLDSSSFFLDVGSGIGKPNFHVAIDPGVQVSFGLEIDDDRWLLSMNCLIATHQCANRFGAQKCIFIKGDIKNANVFDPFTHVYMFSIGFPPALWVELADIWNRSASLYLICFHAPKDVIGAYEFDAELLAHQSTTMHGSQQHHTAYVYRRLSSKKTTINIDPLFAEGIEIAQGGFDHVRKWAEKINGENLHCGRRTRNHSGRHDTFS